MKDATRQTQLFQYSPKGNKEKEENRIERMRGRTAVSREINWRTWAGSKPLSGYWSKNSLGKS